ncbi:hypothetical protein [Desulfoplanes sp.]
MLTIRCATCRQKLWKYKKLGHGSVLRCHKDRIDKMLCSPAIKGDKICCPCGQTIGIDKGSFYKMIKKAFVHSGTKENI